MPVRRRQPRRLDTGAAERYREMGIAAALSRPWDYPTACSELAALLRVGYADLPKASQTLIAGDVLLAFRLLPDVQTGYAVTAANDLVQAVEVVLPKQKKAQAVSEFKRSVVAHKRRSRIQQEPGLKFGDALDGRVQTSKETSHCLLFLLKYISSNHGHLHHFIILLHRSLHIPHDVLVHIFSFMDMHSLVAAGLVCWSWNSVANDNKLWKMNYSLFFNICHVNCNNIPVSGGVRNSDGLLVQNSTGSVFADPNLNWKEVFRNKYAECGTWSFASNRALCRHCGSVIWLSNLTCAAPHHCPKNGKGEVKLGPLLPYTVADYILHVDDLAASLSDSDDTDSDSEDYRLRLFWMLQ